jgi:hypothetical protein
MGGTNSKFPTKGELKNMSKESLNELMENIKEQLKSSDDVKLKRKYRKNIKKLKEFLHVNHSDNRMNHMDMMDHHTVRKSPARVRKSPVRARKSPVLKSPVLKSPVLKSPVGKLPVRKSPVGKLPVRKSPVALRRNPNSAFSHRVEPDHNLSAFASLQRKQNRSAFSHHNRSSFMMDDNSSVASSDNSSVASSDNSSVASSVVPSSFFGRRK